MTDFIALGTRPNSAADTGTLIPAQDGQVWGKLTIPNIVRKRSEILLAASNSRNKDYADHVCDGTADDADLNNALSDLPATGGKIRMAAGSYVFAAMVEILKDGVTIEGDGHGGLAVDGTTIRPAQAFANNTFVIMAHRAAEDRPLVGVEIKNLAIRANTLNNAVSGIDFCVYRGLISGVIVQSMTQDGLQLRQIPGNTNRETVLFDSHFAQNSRHGIYSLGCTDQIWSHLEVHNNGVSNFTGNLSSVQIGLSQFYAGATNPISQQTVRNIHISTGGNKVRFTDCRIEHGAQELLFMDGATNGGEVMLTGCTFRNGGGAAANTYSQLRISGNSTWVLNVGGATRFYADVSSPKYNIDFPTGSSILRFARIAADTRFADAATGATPAVTTTSLFKGTIGNLGVNAGDPNSAGDWLNSGYHGAIVRNTADGALWVCTAAPSTWTLIPLVGGGGATVRSGEITVAASNSEYAGYADFNCDGTDDQVQIQAAIDALPATGGTVKLWDGTFRLASGVLIDGPSVVLEGQGRATTLEPTNAFPNDTHMIKVYDDANSTFGCVVRGLRLSGINTVFTNPLVHGLWFTSELGIVDDVRVFQMSGDAMWIRNNPADSNVSKARFTRLDLAACGRYGLNAQSGDNHFSDSIFRANVDSNIYGSLTGCMFSNCHIFASTENKAGTQTLYGMHILASDRNYFANCKFEHARKSVVWLDANPSGGSAHFVNCCVRNGSGEGAGLHPQVLVSRAGGAFWNMMWHDSRFDADAGQPSWNIQINGGAVRNGRFVGNVFLDATVGTVSPFTSIGTGSVGYRSTVDNLGVNSTNPNSAGDWAGAGRVGTMVRALDTGVVYICTVAPSTWVAIS